MQYDAAMEKLRAAASPSWAANSMARFGIETASAYGVSMPAIRKLAREIGKDHALALQLWDSGVHEARILAALVDDPAQVTEEQMERWVGQFDSWDVCDQCCGGLFDKTPLAYAKAAEWSHRQEEFVKRAGFALMAYLAVHDKKAPDEPFVGFLSDIKRESADGRNFVKKAANWALREIGKRSPTLNGVAIGAAEEIAQIDSRPARWIASDALRELKSEAVQKRLEKRESNLT